MIKVYFETPKNSYAELVAIFDSEETYIACLPSLKKLAKENGFQYVTDTVEDAEISDLKNNGF